MRNSFLDEFGEVLLLAAVAACDEGCACGQWKGIGVDGCFDVSERHAFRLHADAAGRRSLPRGKAVDLVVHDDVEQVHVAAHGVNEMVAADPEAVSVPARHDHSELVIGELQTSGYR